MTAPALAKSASAKPAALPQPDSTRTWKPDSTSRLTAAGTNAVRRSPGRVSATTPTTVDMVRAPSRRRSCGGAAGKFGISRSASSTGADQASAIREIDSCVCRQTLKALPRSNRSTDLAGVGLPDDSDPESRILLIGVLSVVDRERQWTAVNPDLRGDWPNVPDLI
jgi:hypothetical protein